MTATYSLAGGLSAFLEPSRALFWDQRLTTSFEAATSAILSSGRTRIRQMARLSPALGMTSHAERRLRRLVHHQHRRMTRLRKRVLEMIALSRSDRCGHWRHAFSS